MIKRTLQELCLNITDGKHGDCENEENSGYYFISCKDIFDGQINYKNARQITKADFEETHKRTMLEVDDILLTNSGTIGRMAFVTDREATTKTTFQKSVAIIKPDKQKVLPRYLYYQLQNCVPQFINSSNGSAQKNLLLSTMRTFQIEIEENREKQEKIADTLSAYDDLIENNQKQIKLLEEAARRLYKEWFVDLHFPGHENTKIVDGVPEGWQWCKVRDVADINSSALPKNYKEDFIDYVDLGSVRCGHIETRTRYNLNEAPGRAKRCARDGDIIWGMVRPNLKAYALVTNPKETDVFSTGFAVLSAKKVPYSYLYCAVTQEEFVGYLVNATNGAAYPAVKPVHFEVADILKPDDKVLEQFHSVADSIYRKKEALENQNHNLRESRDLILPKLMSGEVEV
jgi:type I restriction-modification system DNA specificity subunit